MNTSTMSLSHQLEQWLRSGGHQLGQILIKSDWDRDVFELRHFEDAHSPIASLKVYDRAEDARDLARYNAAGEYRPVKFTADLIRGWSLQIKDLRALREALDYFYPASFGVWLAHRRGQLPVTSLRSTLNRQTGIYRITQLITDDDARDVIDRVCGPCTRLRLWELESNATFDSSQTSDFPAVIPPLCPEACNVFVGECRKAVKNARKRIAAEKA